MKTNNNILTIIKKEFARFFGDKRMMSTLILPGVMIYIIYSFMGSAITDRFTSSDDYAPRTYIVGLPESMGGLIDALNLSVTNIPASDIGDAKAMVSKKELDLCIVFPDGFDESVASHGLNSDAVAPNIEIYFNSADVNSASAYGKAVAALGVYESGLANVFDVNEGVADADQATKEDTSASLISTLMPMLLLMLLFSGCMGIAPESIAGEKERGTIATLLVTPIKRGQLAIGKIVSLGALSFIGGLSSFLGIMFSLPKIYGAAADNMSTNIYNATDYLYLALVIISSMLLFVTLVSIISAFSKSVKEATTAVTPLMIVVMLVGVTAMFGNGAQSSVIYYFIPVYNSVQSMVGIFSLEYNMVNIAITFASNLLFACIGAFALTKMFNSERVMFSK